MAEPASDPSDADDAQAFVRPVRTSYRHVPCGAVTTVSRSIAETWARRPGYFAAALCASCRSVRPVGAAGEFVWDGTSEKVGT